MQNSFCYLKGIVDCESGTIQDCNNKRTVVCPIDQEKINAKPKLTVKKVSIEKTGEKKKEKGFCFLKGMVECSAGRIQDCNIKRVTVCPED